MDNRNKIKNRIAVVLMILVLIISGCSPKEEVKDSEAEGNDVTENVSAATMGRVDTDETADSSEGEGTKKTADSSEAEGTEKTADSSEAEGTEKTAESAGAEAVKEGGIADFSEDNSDSGLFDIKEVQAALDAGTVTIEELAQRFGMPADQLEAYLNMASEVSAGMSGDMGALAGMYNMDGGQTDVGEPELPKTSSEFSKTLAMQALTLCTGHSKEGQAAIFEENGFEVLLQNNYDKAYSDPSHTCAYTVGRKRINYNGEEKTLIFVAIRGTNGGEWISNFNFAESRSADTVYAENFMYAAQSISVELVPVLISEPDALVMVSGHSRGAAAANLLGMLLNETRGSENVFCYTFATPNTYRGSEPKEDCDNIFNIINPCDVVTKMPLTGLGYRHVGTDIILPGDSSEIERIDSSMNVMYEVAPSIKAYYEERHSLTGAGLSEDGMTPYEVMLAMAFGMTGIKTEENGGVSIQQLYSVLAENPGSAESDLAPLFEILQSVIGADGSYGVGVFAQHMPATYRKLLGVMPEPEM